MASWLNNVLVRVGLTEKKIKKAARNRAASRKRVTGVQKRVVKPQNVSSKRAESVFKDPSFKNLDSFDGDIAIVSKKDGLLARPIDDHYVVFHYKPKGTLPEHYVVLCLESIESSIGKVAVQVRTKQSEKTRLKVLIFKAKHVADIKKFYELKGGRRIANRLFDESELISRFNSYVVRAAAEGSSDVHFMVRDEEEYSQIKCRKNLDLVPIGQELTSVLTQMIQASWRSEAKTSAEFNPQVTPCHARYHFRNKKGEPVRLRLQTISDGEGYDLVGRILPGSCDMDAPIDFLSRGYHPEQVEILKTVLLASKGLILFCGATNSGKSTSLVDCMRYKYNAAPKQKMYSIEDPVEFALPFVTQSGITEDLINDPHGEISWSNFLNALLRADGNVVMIGEIRNGIPMEKTDTIIKTGPLTLSTLHASSSQAAVSRLMEEGGITKESLCGPDYLNLVVSQKLIRCVCDRCSLNYVERLRDEDDVAMRSILRKKIGFAERYFDINLLRFRNTEGCSDCNHTGVVGITVIADFLVVDKDVRTFIRDDRVDELNVLVNIEKGQMAMSDHAMLKAADGVVDYFEALAAIAQNGEPECPQLARLLQDSPGPRPPRGQTAIITQLFSERL